VVKPLGVTSSGEEFPAISLGGKPIIRCKDCRAYVNPFVRFVDNGMKWICNFCGDLNNTESYYYSPTSKSGVRNDHDQRPELFQGSVDFIASGEYMSRPPMPPTFVFVIDVSKPAIDSGYVSLTCQTIRSCIEFMNTASNERCRVGFITYDQSVHFYNLRSTLKQPQMFVVSDVEKIFLPQPDDLIVNVTDSFDIICNLLDNLPNYFARSQSQDSNLFSALHCATSMMRAVGGKMVVF
jgi:protein transport protein SEC24